MNVYEISQQYAALNRLMSDNEIDEETFDNTIAGIAGEFNNRCEAMAFAIKNMRLQAEAIKNAAKNMNDRAFVISKNADRLNEFLLSSMKAAGVERVDSVQLEIKLALNPPKLVIDNESEIPGGFYDPVPAHKLLNNKRLKYALKDVDIPGAHLEQKTRLVIK